MVLEAFVDPLLLGRAEREGEINGLTYIKVLFFSTAWLTTLLHNKKREWACYLIYMTHNNY